MSNLDAVILAGGKSERLNGIVPPYHKPFLVVNGKSLLVAAVEHAQRVNAQRIIIVATGENALPVWQLVGHVPNVRVVLNADGPGKAVATGLELCVHDRVLVLMSDNVHRPQDIQAVAATSYAIGTRRIPSHEAVRFTRLKDGRWAEGPDVELTLDDYPVTVWCGPLVVDRICAMATLFDKEKIGPYLIDLSPRHTPPLLVPVRSYDVGIPSVVAEVTKEQHSWTA